MTKTDWLIYCILMYVATAMLIRGFSPYPRKGKGWVILIWLFAPITTPILLVVAAASLVFMAWWQFLFDEMFGE